MPEAHIVMYCDPAPTGDQLTAAHEAATDALPDGMVSVSGAHVGPDPDDQEAVLRWTCETCGWNVLVPMPGYAGDGHKHYSADTACGPLVARREGFLRAHPGTSTVDLDRMARESVLAPRPAQNQPSGGDDRG